MAWLVGSATNAQQRYESTIVDSTTGEPLPYASITTNNSHRSATISNAEGTFSITCMPTDSLQLSMTGYSKRTLKAADLSDTTSLVPTEKLLSELLVKPLKLHNFIRQTTKETLSQTKLHADSTATFYYRQTSFCDTTCNEFLEAFLTAQPAVELRQPTLLTGRYAALPPDSIHPYAYYRNYYTFSQLQLVDKKREHDPDETIIPLTYYYRNYYHVDHSYTFDQQGNSLVVINFTPREKIRRPILAATLYVDEQTCHIRKVVGHGVNTFIRTGTWLQESYDDDSRPYFTQIIHTDFQFTITMTERRGFTEIESIHVVTTHDDDNGSSITTSTLLYNVAPDTPSANSGNPLPFYGHLHKQIEAQGYSPDFWSQNEIVRRTPLEQKVVALFTTAHLFGQFSTP